MEGHISHMLTLSTAAREILSVARHASGARYHGTSWLGVGAPYTLQSTSRLGSLSKRQLSQAGAARQVGATTMTSDRTSWKDLMVAIH
jgi:hypothetical protein